MLGCESGARVDDFLAWFPGAARAGRRSGLGSSLGSRRVTRGAGRREASAAARGRRGTRYCCCGRLKVRFDRGPGSRSSERARGGEANAASKAVVLCLTGLLGGGVAYRGQGIQCMQGGGSWGSSSGRCCWRACWLLCYWPRDMAWLCPPAISRSGLPALCGNACVFTGSSDCMCTWRAVEIVCGSPPNQIYGSDCIGSTNCIPF